MNIDSIKLYSSGFDIKSKHGDYGAHEFIRKRAQESEEKSVNRGYYSGSFTGKNGAAVVASYEKLGETLWDKTTGSGVFKSLLKVFEDKSAVASSLVALVMAGMPRPITNLAMAGKDDRDDSIYAASHAIASAIIGFLVSSVVMHPFDKAFLEIKENPKKYLSGQNLEEVFGVTKIGPRKLEKSKAYTKLRKAAQMGIDTIFLGIPKAMLTIAMIPPILKYVFHLEKGSSKRESLTKNTARDIALATIAPLNLVISASVLHEMIKGGGNKNENK